MEYIYRLQIKQYDGDDWCTIRTVAASVVGDKEKLKKEMHRDMQRWADNYPPFRQSKFRIVEGYETPKLSPRAVTR